MTFSQRIAARNVALRAFALLMEETAICDRAVALVETMNKYLDHDNWKDFREQEHLPEEFPVKSQLLHRAAFLSKDRKVIGYEAMREVLHEL